MTLAACWRHASELACSLRRPCFSIGAPAPTTRRYSAASAHFARDGRYKETLKKYPNSPAGNVTKFLKGRATHEHSEPRFTIPHRVFPACWSLTTRKVPDGEEWWQSALETSHVAVHIWDETSPALVQLDFYTCGTLDTDAILRAINPWGVVKKAFLVLDREKELEALEMA